MAGGKLAALKAATLWLYRIANNVANDHLRRQRLLCCTSLDASGTKQTGPYYSADTASAPLSETLVAERGGDDLPDLIDNKDAVRAVLVWMPSHLRAHVLYGYDGVSLCDRAAIAHTTEHIMEMQSSRARKLFRQGFAYYSEHGRVPKRKFSEPAPGAARLEYMPAPALNLDALALAVAEMTS